MINVFAITLFFGQLNSPVVSNVLPNTIISFSEKTERFHETYEVDAGTKLHIVNVNGDINLKQWDKDHIEVNATKMTDRDEDELARVAGPLMFILRMAKYGYTGWLNDQELIVGLHYRIPGRLSLLPFTDLSVF